MKPKTLIMVAGSLVAATLLSGSLRVSGQVAEQRLVRIAELEIEPAQLVAYKSALREEIEASIRIEPGVLTLYAVSIKDQPSQIRLFEVYANNAAYEAHLQSGHFRKYKSATAGMVRSLKLIETEPLLLDAK